ncbi:hypothetical protein DV515_00012019, partial [Chloebia gouldiae]
SLDLPYLQGQPHAVDIPNHAIPLLLLIQEAVAHCPKCLPEQILHILELHVVVDAGYGSGRGSAPGNGHAGDPGRRRGGRGHAEPPLLRSCLWGQGGSQAVLGWAPQELAEAWSPRS